MPPCPKGMTATEIRLGEFPPPPQTGVQYLQKWCDGETPMISFCSACGAPGNHPVNGLFADPHCGGPCADQVNDGCNEGSWVEGAEYHQSICILTSGVYEHMTYHHGPGDSCNSRPIDLTPDPPECSKHENGNYLGDKSGTYDWSLGDIYVSLRPFFRYSDADRSEKWCIF